jgi:hypothetical protein
MIPAGGRLDGAWSGDECRGGREQAAAVMTASEQ